MLYAMESANNGFKGVSRGLNDMVCGVRVQDSNEKFAGNGLSWPVGLVSLLVTYQPDSTFLIFMGLLAVGTPLTWEEAFKYADHVRYHGITQLLNIWERYKTRAGDKLYWGDEVSVLF